MVTKRKIVKTKSGSLKTPLFLPDATRGYVKLLNNQELIKAKTMSMVVNTYHLLLQPGLKIIKKAGGINNYMNWTGPLVSDSGGFQVFSLVHKNKKMGKIDDEKVIFKSPIDGSINYLSPEKSIQIQFDLGTDIMFCLDDCPPANSSEQETRNAVDRTIKWALRCKKEYLKQIKKRKIDAEKRPLIFAVVQGGGFLDLRKKCLDSLLEIGFDGLGFGGGPVKFDGSLEKVSKLIVDNSPKNYLLFALGLGLPEDIVSFCKTGWHFFDCVIPTREGRHGKLFFLKKNGDIQINNQFYKTINVSNSKYAKDFSPINPDSTFFELRSHSKAYLHHLFKLNEPLGLRMASLNNLEFYNKIFDSIYK